MQIQMSDSRLSSGVRYIIPSNRPAAVRIPSTNSETVQRFQETVLRAIVSEEALA